MHKLQFQEGPRAASGEKLVCVFSRSLCLIYYVSFCSSIYSSVACCWLLLARDCLLAVVAMIFSASVSSAGFTSSVIHPVFLFFKKREEKN